MSIPDTAPARDGPSPAAAMHSERPQADKRKRRSAPKVKTGCRECKIAHVRCDEKQPACGRCQRRKTTCVYQPVVQHKKRDEMPHTGQYRILLPAATVVRPSRLVQPSVTFLNPREVQYFDTFRHSVIFQLGYGNDEFWRRTVLRESSRDDCIRNAVVAVGALVRAQEEHDQVSATEKKTKEWTTHKPQLPLYKASLTSSSSHYYHALTHYTKAVASFRRLIAIASRGNDSGAARAVLIATILLVAFESLQGNTPSADQLGAGTLALLQDSILQGTLRGASNQNKNEKPPPSQIAGSIDDEGTYDTELMLVRNTFFSSGLSPAYPKAREVVTRLARTTPTRGPLPPDAVVDIVVFSRLWSRCLMLSAFWYVRMVHMSWGMQQPHNTTSGLSAESDPWADFRDEQNDIMETLESWKMAAEKRIATLTARVSALAASDTVPVNATKLAAAEHELITYEEVAVAAIGCYLSVCTVFDKCGETWEQHEAVTEDVVGRIERMLSRKKAAAAMSDHTTSSGDVNNGCYQLRHYYGGFEGSRLILGHIASVIRKPELRKRLMNLWRSELDSRSHWDIQGNYLGSRAVYEVEEAQRDEVTGELPMTKQYHWLQGKWSEDYADFEVTLISKAPGDNGMPEMKVVVMPALKP